MAKEKSGLWTAFGIGATAVSGLLAIVCAPAVVVGVAAANLGAMAACLAGSDDDGGDDDDDGSPSWGMS
jgi:hypothetical protein